MVPSSSEVGDPPDTAQQSERWWCSSDSSTDTEQEPVQRKQTKAPIQKKKPSKARNVRKYTKWSEDGTALVKDYFQEYFAGCARKKLPGRKEIMEFLEKSSLEHDWLTVRSKIMNEIRLEKERAKRREEEWY